MKSTHIFISIYSSSVNTLLGENTLQIGWQSIIGHNVNTHLLTHSHPGAILLSPSSYWQVVRVGRKADNLEKQTDTEKYMPVTQTVKPKLRIELEMLQMCGSSSVSSPVPPPFIASCNKLLKKTLAVRSGKNPGNQKCELLAALKHYEI